jgi:hypothetical protein
MLAALEGSGQRSLADAASSKRVAKTVHSASSQWLQILDSTGTLFVP